MKLIAIAATLMLISSTIQAGTLTVTEPHGVDDKVAEGRDYATYELGNPWDMSDQDDVVLTESLFVANETISGGLYSATSMTNDPQFYLIWQGFHSSYLGLDEGQLHPIDTSIYRFLTMRIRVTPVAGNAPSFTFVQAFFFPDEDTFVENNFGQSAPVVLDTGTWQILEIDLATQSLGSPSWTDFAQVRGLRIDPASDANMVMEIDWIRLTAAGSATGSMKTVSWSGGSSPFTIAAMGAQGVRHTLARSVGGSSVEVDTSSLPPGDYIIEVSGEVSGGGTGSNGPLTINQAPVFTFIEPDRRGDEANRYSIVNTSNAWASIEPVDLDLGQSINLTNISFADPIGALRADGLPGDGITGDPGVVMNTPIEIDTERYRVMCYEIEVSGDRDIGAGSVARILYGNDTGGGLVPTEDIIVQEGRNEYCLGDMRQVPLEGGASHQWLGSLRFMRVDPYEFTNPRTFRLYSVLLAPFDTALAAFDFMWDIFNPDDAAWLDLYLDPDQIPRNGNDILIGQQLNAASGLFTWTVGVPDGLYFVYGAVTDGLNTVTRYAEEKLQVGAGTSVLVEVVEPDGINDSVAEGDDFANIQKGNRWDMAGSEDIELTINIDNPQFFGGVFSGTAANEDPAVFLQNPTSTSTRIDTSRYRFLTAKVRLTGGAEPHFMNVIFYTGDTTTNFGFTSGKVVPGGNWEIITFDLEHDVPGDSPSTWAGAGMASGLRIDPTGSAGTTFEIAWVRLTAPNDGSSTYTIHWTEDNLMGSVFDVRLVDPDGAAVTLADDLLQATLALPVDMSFYEPGDYDVEVEAQPGPSSRSTGPLTVVD